MKPTVGRIVYYKSFGTPKGEYKPEDRAAIVTAVKDDETLDLCVLNPTGMFFNQDVKQGTHGGQWDWMPYQREQALKAEQESETVLLDGIFDALRRNGGTVTGRHSGEQENKSFATLHSEYFNSIVAENSNTNGKGGK